MVVNGQQGGLSPCEDHQEKSEKILQQNSLAVTVSDLTSTSTQTSVHSFLQKLAQTGPEITHVNNPKAYIKTNPLTLLAAIVVP